MIGRDPVGRGGGGVLRGVETGGVPRVACGGRLAAGCGS
jgi:hypothetical protein